MSNYKYNVSAMYLKKLFKIL